MLRAAALRRGPRASLLRRMSTVQMITSEEAFAEAVAKPSLSVVYYTATWCGPCQRISPVFAKLAEDNPAVSFVKVDVDDMADIAAQAGISAMPTFHFMKESKVLDQLVGADDRKLIEYVKSHQ